MNEPTPSYPVARDYTLETLCHLLGLAGLTGIPFANVLAPLILWIWKRETNAAVEAHGKEVLNFQLSVTLYIFLAGLSMFLLVGFVLLPLVLIADVVLIIMASIKASQGEFYRYPGTIRFIN